MYTKVTQCFYRLYSLKVILDNGYSSLCCTTYPSCLFILHMAVCIFQSHTPNLLLFTSLSPLITTGLFSVFVSLFYYDIHLYYFLDSTISDIIQYLCFSDLLY